MDFPEGPNMKAPEGFRFSLLEPFFSPVLELSFLKKSFYIYGRDP
jgi:hypothetical protein